MSSSTWVDAKGKVFTNVVRKEQWKAVIQTLTHSIRGQVYVRPGLRFKDELNGNAEQFIAVTEAVVSNISGEVVARSDFLTVNKNHIVWAQPEDDEDEHAPPPTDDTPYISAESER